MAEANPVAQEDREGNEASEPEDHGQAFDARNYAGMIEFGLREAHRYDDQVCERDQGNDRAEQEEADLRGCASVPVTAPPVGDCEYLLDSFSVKVRSHEEHTIARQAQYEDCENRLNNPENKDEVSTFVESHLGQILGRVLRRSVVNSGSVVGNLRGEEYCVFGFPIEEGGYGEDFGCTFVVSQCWASLFQPAI